MKLLTSSVFALVLGAQSSAYGSVIKVEFDVTIATKRTSSYQNEPFIPLTHQVASLTFDDSLTAVDRLWAPTNSIMSHVWSTFGSAHQTSILSPIANLTATNPIANTPVDESSSMRSVLWYSLGPPEYSSVSFAHQIVASATLRSMSQPNGPNSYEGESWERVVSIGGPIEYYGPMDEADIASYSFSTTDLLIYLTRMKDTAAEWSFSDGFSYENRPTLLRNGLTWSGTAVITKIVRAASVDVPEPASLTLFGLALPALTFARRRRRT